MALMALGSGTDARIAAVLAADGNFENHQLRDIEEGHPRTAERGASAERTSCLVRRMMGSVLHIFSCRINQSRVLAAREASGAGATGGPDCRVYT